MKYPPPGHRYRRDTWAAERIDAAGEAHHFRNPVAARMRRIEPLQTDDAHPRSIRDRGHHSGESLPKRGDQLLRARVPSGRVALRALTAASIAELVSVAPPIALRVRRGSSWACGG